MLDMDVVIPYKNEGSDLELRYTLRGIAKYLPHRNVFILGDLPDWVTNVYHIPRKEIATSSFDDVNKMVMQACQDERISDDFTFFNDDIFCLEPIKSIPDYYLGTLDEDHKRRRKKHGPANRWSMGTLRTMQFIQQLGIKEPLSYEVHMPMIMNKQKRLEVAKIIDGKFTQDSPLFARSIYGNLYSVNSEFKADVKFVGRGDGFDLKSPYLSTLQTRFVDSKVGKHIMFKLNEKCRYES